MKKLLATQSESINQGFYSYVSAKVEASNAEILINKYYRCHRYEAHPMGMGYRSRESKFVYYRAHVIDTTKPAWVVIKSSQKDGYFIIQGAKWISVNRSTWNAYRKKAGAKLPSLV